MLEWLSAGASRRENPPELEADLISTPEDTIQAGEQRQEGTVQALENRLTEATTLEEVWDLLLTALLPKGRLESRSPLSFISLTLVDDTSMQLPFFAPRKRQREEASFFGLGRSSNDSEALARATAGWDIPRISRDEAGHHLVETLKRGDTTFGIDLHSLHPDLGFLVKLSGDEARGLHLFSIPCLAADGTPAGIVTLGVSKIELATQDRISFVYLVRQALGDAISRLQADEALLYTPDASPEPPPIQETELQAETMPAVQEPVIDDIHLVAETSYPEAESDLPPSEPMDKAPEPVAEVSTPAEEAPITDTAESASETTPEMARSPYVEQVLAADIERLRTTTEPLAVLLIGFVRQEGQPLNITQLIPKLRETLRDGDRVFHRNEQLAVLVTGLEAPQLERLAQRLCRTPWAPVPIGVGVANYRQDGLRANELIENATKALRLARFRTERTGQATVVAAHQHDMLKEKILVDMFCEQVASQKDATADEGEPAAFDARHVTFDQLSDALIHRLEHGQHRPELLPRDEAAHVGPYIFVETLASLLETYTQKYPYETLSGIVQTARLAVALGRAVQMEPEQQGLLRFGTLLLPLGRAGLPTSVLMNHTGLDVHDWTLIKLVPTLTLHQLLVQFNLYGNQRPPRPLIAMIEGSTEHWDGSGYPNGITGTEIPLTARVAAVASAFTAMTSPRPQRPAMSMREALDTLQEGAGQRWDPTLVAAFAGMIDIALRVR